MQLNKTNYNQLKSIVFCLSLVLMMLMNMSAFAQETETEQDSVKQVLKTAEVELLLGKQLSGELLNSHEELAFRVSKMRKKFATQFGFVVPEIKVSDDISIDEKSYHIF